MLKTWIAVLISTFVSDSGYDLETNKEISERVLISKVSFLIQAMTWEQMKKLAAVLKYPVLQSIKPLRVHLNFTAHYRVVSRAATFPHH